MKVQVVVGARDLPDSSGSLATISLAGEELGRTEVVTDSSNPSWVKVSVLDFDDIEEKDLTVAICSESDGSSTGDADFNLSSLLEKKVDKKPMEGGGSIFVFAAEHEVLGSLNLQLCANGLKNTEGFLGMSREKSDPFLTIKGTSGDDVHTSDVVSDTLDPVFPKVDLPLSDLCDGNLDGPLEFTIHDYDRDGSHDFMGSFSRSVNDIISIAASGDAVDLSKKGNVLVLVAELVDYVNPVEVGHAAIEASALVMKAEVDSESKSEKAARALEKAEEARAEAEKARAEADEKESQTQELAEQLADAEKAAEDAKAAAQNAADEAASQPVAGVIKFKLRGEKLKNTEGLFRKPDPFFALQKPKEDGDDWDNVLISNVERDTLNPSWGEVEVEICALGDGDLDGVLRVVVFDHEKDGKHDLMGFFESSVNGLLSASETDEFISIMRKGRETGQIFVEEADLSGYVDPEETKQQLKELNDKADTARFFVMGKSAAVKSATDAAEEAQSTAEYMAQKAETAAEQAETASSEFEAAKAALEEAASKLAALVE